MSGGDPAWRIRRARAGDVGELVRLERVSFPREDWFPAHRFRRWLREPEGRSVWVAAGRDGLLGDAVVLYRRGARVARLYNLVVDPAARRQGIAAALLAAAKREAARRGCDRIFLEVRASNRAAVSFYPRHGFAMAAELPGYYPDGETGLRMLFRG